MVFREGSTGSAVPRTAVRRLLELLAESLRRCDARLAGGRRDYPRLLLQMLDEDLENLESDEARNISQDDLAEVRRMVDALNERYEKG